MTKKDRLDREKKIAAYLPKIRTGEINAYTAMKESGYPESMCKRGMASISQSARSRVSADEKAKLAKGNHYLAHPELMERLAIGTAAQNAIAGTDKGVRSAELLGKHKKVDCWRNDMQTGVIILNWPQAFIDNKAELLSGIVDGVDGDGRPAPGQQPYDAETLRLRPWLNKG